MSRHKDLTATNHSSSLTSTVSFLMADFTVILTSHEVEAYIHSL